MTTWILVAQRDGAHVYGWTDPKDPLHPLHDLDHRDGKLHEATPAKGATHESSSHRSHAHAVSGNDQTRFVKELVDFLDHARAAGTFDRLFIVCESQFLGDLLANMPAPTKAKIAGEVKKNLGHLAAKELREHLLHDGLFFGTRADA